LHQPEKEKLIHKFTSRGTQILLDINSGTVFEIDAVTDAVLDQYCRRSKAEIIAYYKDKYAAAEVDEAWEEIADWERQGLLFTTDVLADTYNPAGEPVVKALCLHVAHDCNLRCRYCFADAGEYMGKREIMPPAVAKAAIDFVLTSSHGRKYIEVDFFGGEPLLNLGVVKDTVAYARALAGDHGKEFRFTLTTNAVLLTEAVRNYLRENNISVVLSLDGRPEVNDRTRVFPGGQGSYATILPNIRAMIELLNNEGYYVRGTYTRWNADFTNDVVHLADLGFKHISVEPVVADSAAPYALTSDLLPALEREYDRLTDIYLERFAAGTPFNFFHFNINTDNGPCLPKRLTGCGAGYEYLAVTPTGDLYPCHQFVGRTEYRMGSVFTGIERPELSRTFRQAHIYSKPQCRECWARFFCSGGCHANAVAFGGDLLIPYELACALEKKRVECALYIDVRKRATAGNK